MKWVAISGSWRKTNKQVENDVRRIVKEIINSGNGIISGGALGVDYFATDEAMKLNPNCDRLRIFLPTSLEIYASYSRKRAKEGVITKTQANRLITQLENLRKTNPSSLIESSENKIMDRAAYFQRHSEVIANADELVAFQINQSEGVADTVRKAKQKGIPTKLFEYVLG